MGMIFKTIIAFCVGWGVLTAAQHLWLSAMTAQIAETSQSQILLSPPVSPTMSIDPEKLRLAINPTIEPIDTRAAQRAAAESMIRQIDLQNRAALSKVPLPPSIPGMPRH